jgi:hypothetical protein
MPFIDKLVFTSWMEIYHNIRKPRTQSGLAVPIPGKSCFDVRFARGSCARGGRLVRQSLFPGGESGGPADNWSG